jgi:CTP synthase
VRSPTAKSRIAVVGKYTALLDAYKSLAEALAHGGIANNVKVNLDWIDSEIFEKDPRRRSVELEEVNGILVPGGFGERGTEGKIARPASPANARCPTSASASACRWR